MCVTVKSRCYCSFTINSQLKLKKFSTTFLRHLPIKARYEIQQGFMVGSCVGDPRNFHNSFFDKNYYLNLNFFQVLQSALLKNPKILVKKDTSHLKIAWHGNRQKKSIEKRKRETKNEITILFYFYFFTYIYIFTFIS